MVIGWAASWGGEMYGFVDESSVQFDGTIVADRADVCSKSTKLFSGSRFWLFGGCRLNVGGSAYCCGKGPKTAPANAVLYVTRGELVAKIARRLWTCWRDEGLDRPSSNKSRMRVEGEK